jgi:hypothetical protein
MISQSEMMHAVTALRWEWRTFGEQLGGAETRLGSMTPEGVAESDETYLLTAESVDAVKVRGGLMDVKHLAQVDDNQLELWKPVMKSALPISPADAGAVLAALGVSAPLDRDTYDLADLAKAAGDAVRGPRPQDATAPHDLRLHGRAHGPPHRGPVEAYDRDRVRGARARDRGGTRARAALATERERPAGAQGAHMRNGSSMPNRSEAWR